ncbi:MAG: dephospho-CoA kinase, partial [Gammaproteobacteria bacterium]|nr:dephospho-CoA kinase [Gammaproteobacteria bacterium]
VLTWPWLAGLPCYGVKPSIIPTWLFSDMLKIGLTGGIGCGKTSVSNLFAELGVPVIDADIVAHDLVNTNSNILQEITDTFGQDVLSLDGTLNRKKLAQIIFNQKKNKQQLEQILHPKVQTEISRELDKLASKKNPPAYVIVVVPLLIEANYHNLVDRILVVLADEESRIERVRQRDSRSLNEIRAIMKNQISDDERLKNADDSIENNNNFNDLKSKTIELHNKYLTLSETNEEKHRV